jgi:atrial natriuretic peptide receptor A
MASRNLCKRIFLFIFFTNLLYIHVASRKQVNLGVILPFGGQYSWTRPKVGPALGMALERLTAHTELLPGYRLQTTWADSKCSSTFGPLEAIDMHCKQQVHVFFGLACNYALAPVARFSPYWNTPVISIGGLVKGFDDKTHEYKLLTRVSSPYTKAAEFVLSVLSQWNWNIIGLLYQKNKYNGGERLSCHFQMEALFSALMRSSKYKVWHKAFGYASDSEYSDVLQAAAANSRSKYYSGFSKVDFS